MAKVYDRYLEAEVLSADPLKLVSLLYRGAQDSVRGARASLAEGDIRGRTSAINRAWSIVRELASSLDHERGGKLSQRLGGLYSYMQTRLIEANVKQSDEPLAEVEDLLATLAEAWQAANAPTHEDPDAAEASAASVEPEPDGLFERGALVLA